MAPNKARSLSLFVLGVSLSSAACSESEPVVRDSISTWEVRRGDLKISVTEKAEIQAANKVTVVSKVEGRVTLTYLVPEGNIVAKGDKLAQLDVSDLEEKRNRQAISVAKAEASLAQAQKTYEIMEKDLAADLNAARGKLKIAQMELEKFRGRQKQRAPDDVEGTNQEMLTKLRELMKIDPKGRKYSDLDQTVLELLGAKENLHRDMGQLANDILQKVDEIRLARAELVLKLDKYNHSVELADQEFITRNELERDKLSYQSQLSTVNLAWNDLDLLINYTLAQTQIQLNLDVENADLELLSAIGNSESRRVKEEVELKSKDAEVRLAHESLANWDEQIRNGIIYAPNPGLVVYAKQSQRWNAPPVEEGMEIRKGQSLIELPDLSLMIAELKVQESDVDKVMPELRAIVRADAFQERALNATVSRVAPLPDSAHRWSGNQKVYKTVLNIEVADGLELRPGMSATAEIIVDVLHDVISIPLPSVQREGDHHYVWKQTEFGPVATPVMVGRNSLTEVEVLDGLREGEVVYLAPPTGAQVPEFPQSPTTMPLDAAVAASKPSR